MAKNRSIFEDVSESAAEQPAAPAAPRAPARGAIRGWLIGLFLLVVLMIAVGGLTRLTDSGLSITEWRPVTGAIPPLSATDWIAEFDKYRAIPEYQLQNKGMTLAEFKVIYWWEWGHRQLGRVIGLVWAIGFFGFLATRRIPRGWTLRLCIPGLLGGVQAGIGWWMVSSGLTGTMLDVASYRLATHLGLAFVILGLLAWYILLLGRSEAALLQARRRREQGLLSLSTGVVAVAFAQILSGALVAGIDAGRSYTDWPLMGGALVPSTAFDLAPFWTNFFENAGLVQFNHRLLGYTLFAVLLGVWVVARRSGIAAVRRAWGLVAGIGLLQVVLGIATVMTAAPWGLAILHQTLAVILFAAILNARFTAAYPPEQRIARG